MGRRILPRNHALHTQQRGFTGKKKVLHDPAGVDGDDPFVQADLALTVKISEVLERHYPAHPWMVTVSHAQGYAAIKLPILMKRNQHHILHITTLKSDPGLKCVIRAAGEILERLNIPRAGFAIDHFLHARSKTPYGRARPQLILPG